MELARVRGRSRRAMFIRVVALLALVAILLIDRVELAGPRTDDQAAFHQQQATVTRVIDGDTVVIATADHADVRVRLIGIDAPEAGAPYGQESTAHLRQLAASHTVTLFLQPTTTRDKYRRLLAYLFEGETLINQQMVADGAAYADRRFPHPWDGMFVSAEAAARKGKLGLWAVLSDDQQPQWRKDWLARIRKSRRELEGYRD